MRRSQEIELSRGGITLSEPEVTEFPDAILAKYSGFDSATDRRTFTLIIVNRRAVGSFYLESSGTDAPTFVARANEVFGQVGLVGRGD